MVITTHLNSWIGKFQEVNVGKYPNDGGWGVVKCMTCGHKFSYDIFEYANITEIKNSRSGIELVIICPQCKTKDLEWNLKK